VGSGSSLSTHPNGRALALAVTMDNMAATPRARVLVREQSR